MKIPQVRMRAFTLIELLIVITIIGILAVALVPRITGGPAKARDATRKTDLQQIATALALYADDNSGSYPWDVSTAATSGCVTGNLDSYISDYMTTIPEDAQYDSTGYCYEYYATSNGFGLVAHLESNTGVGDGIYEDNAIGDLVTTVTTGTALTNAADQLCGTVDCTTSTNIPVYIIGR